MRSARSDILDWLEQGRLAPGKLRAALELAGALPGANDWRRFLDRLLLWLGTVMLAAAVVFFFAFNWAELGRLAKIALVQAPLVAALAVVWVLGLERAGGRAALFCAALLAGAVFALIGQTYQTGADPWELFAVWAGAILPWALLARMPALWVLWLALVNLSVALYFLTFGLLWGMLFAPIKLAWILFGLNTAALVAWEALAAAGLGWLRERWSVRILATASGALATWLALHHIFGARSAGSWGLPVWLAWMVAAYFGYRHLRRDLFVLAGGVLSGVIVLVALAGKQVKWNDAGALLFLGLLVIGLSSAGAWWLRSVARDGGDEEEA